MEHTNGMYGNVQGIDPAQFGYVAPTYVNPTIVPSPTMPPVQSAQVTAGMKEGDTEAASSAPPSNSSNPILWICLSLFVVVAIVVIAVLVTVLKADNYGPGAVSTLHPLATQAGIEILEAGGNAIDAAAAIQFVMGVVLPHSTGIGGGFYAMIYEAENKRVYALDAREEAPAAFHPNIFCGGDSCLDGPEDCTCDPVDWEDPWWQLVGSGASVGVPGTVRGVDRMLRDLGTMTLAETLAPAIKIAREGFAASELMVARVERAKQRLGYREASSRLYLNDAGDAPGFAAGDIFKNPDLAATMELLAAEGADAFYEGPLANEIVEAANNSPNPISKKNGVMAAQDLSGYKAVYRQPVRTEYRGHQVYGMGPSTGGGITLAMMLNYVQGFAMGDLEFNSPDYLHRIIDAQNLAFADRNRYLGDEDFVDIPWGDMHAEYCESHESRLLCPAGCQWEDSACRTRGLETAEYATARREELHDDDNAQPTPAPFGVFSSRYDLLEEDEMLKPGTSHWSVADKWGNVVSMTSSIEDNMGSGIVVPGRGILLNNELTDFSTDWSSNTFSGLNYANRPEGGKRPRRTALGADSTTLGGKRPRSSMTPTLVLDADMKPELAIGCPGGSRMTGTVFNALVAHIDAGLTVAEALSAARALSRNGNTELESSGVCNCEPGLYDNDRLKTTLEGKGVSLATVEGTSPFTYLAVVEFNDKGEAIPHTDPRLLLLNDQPGTSAVTA